MSESTWSIPTSDGKTIYGVLNKPTGKTNKKAILHVHGLTGHVYEFSQTTMAARFPEQGYDIIRPYLYHAPDNARKLVDCTLKTHADDIDTIFDHFRKDYDEIFVSGHFVWRTQYHVRRYEPL